MKKGKVFFHPLEGFGPLTISWTSSPKGDAVEAKKGAGVGFFSQKGALLCVIFDEVRSPEDHQTLEFSHDRVEISLKNGRVTYLLAKVRKNSVRRKKSIKRSRLTTKKN